MINQLLVCLWINTQLLWVRLYSLCHDAWIRFQRITWQNRDQPPYPSTWLRFFYCWYTHSKGDTPNNFINFGKKLNLPQTSLVAIQGPYNVPYTDGYSYHTAFDNEGNSTLLLSLHNDQVIQPTLRDYEKFRLQFNALMTDLLNDRKSKSVFLVGFADGGQFALDYALFGGIEIGGVMSINGIINSRIYKTITSTQRTLTHILITNGELSSTNDDVVNVHINSTLITGDWVCKDENAECRIRSHQEPRCVYAKGCRMSNAIH